ncbi:biliverdin-producing heme oxygenase [Sphingobacterium hotanense]|uniref:Biliverdin-producing heme oxygenase n=1 Tax=Sphingobacterium hotanense TaxID=649196 RepID=A0ABT7NN79_9SPHI|nr:biliverdin-producing heme oxygenase [Sphingobacterium hotanense]MDM1048663.1 biliverdin-producing heme oxygenase [Sphingobacterium hotanense]
MLSERIKAATKNGHQNLEKQVVYRLKAIENNLDYADLLKFFFSYFETLEQQIANNIPASLEPYFRVRRSAKDIAKDIAVLGADLADLPQAFLPIIENKNQAIGALYVLEGSIMGGPYIVKMLQKQGIETGFNFFQGYGEQSAEKWAKFTKIINTEVAEEKDIEEAIASAHNTFEQFSNTFTNTINA